MIQIQQRRGTAAQWTSANPTLAAGELGYETDTAKLKLGNGSTAWTSLGYLNANLPTGGTTGQMLAKASATNFDVAWTDELPAQALVVAPTEKVNVTTATPTGTLAIDATTAGIWYFTTNTAANFTVNFRGNSSTTLASLLAVGESITFVLLFTNSTTAYYANAWQIDGSSVTPKWVGGTASTAGNASAIDQYQVWITKTAATPTYLVIAQPIAKVA